MNTHLETIAPIAAHTTLTRTWSDARIPNWQAAAVAEYADTTAAGALSHQQRRRLAEHIRALTGQAIQEDAVVVDAAAQRATVLLDGVLFRLRGDTLVVVRPCAYCGTGLFESAPIQTRSDLGCALTTWEPSHRDCEPGDAPDDTSW